MREEKPELETEEEPRVEPIGAPAKRLRTMIVGIAVVVGVLALATNLPKLGSRGHGPTGTPGGDKAHSERRAKPEYMVIRPPSYSKDHSLNSETVLVWGGDHGFTQSLRKHGSISNIRPVDYAGSESCIECHSENHELWSDHAHRWMNAKADEQTVKGDFSGSSQARLDYLGGTGEFYRRDGDFMMKLTRDKVVREFKINRTIGSRIHQYYIGTLETGPEEENHALRTTEHVLPFGFELTMKEWVPIVHAGGQQGTDSEREDPFEIPSSLPYDISCSICHTTQPIGNLMLAMFKRFAAYSPRKLHFEASNFLDETNPGAVRLGLPKGERLTNDNLAPIINDLTMQAHGLITPENAVNLGISCEACHLGSAAHVKNKKVRPLFFPAGSQVLTSGASDREVWGRNTANKNFTCARCHSGARPQFAAGMATWNSTEYSDAMRGHCYQPAKAKERGMKGLSCVACHNPHESIGRRWDKSAESDRQSCVDCHSQYQDPAIAQTHTRHPVGSSGSKCMNCHMPRINEGMGDMVRTHTIFKPTNVQMLEANQPNACNMCHVEKSIDWTLQHFAEWYGLESKGAFSGPGDPGYSEEAILQNYPDRTRSAALGWLQSPHSATRAVAADVLLKAKAEWALPELLRTLDDPYMEIRQFSVQRLRDYFDIDTGDYGYKLYMTQDERRLPIQKMLDDLAARSNATDEPDANN